MAGAGPPVSGPPPSQNKGSPSASDAERRVQCGDQSGDGGAEAGAGRGSRCVCPQGIRTRKSVSLAAEGGARGGSTLSKSGNSITTTADSILNLNWADSILNLNTRH